MGGVGTKICAAYRLGHSFCTPECRARRGLHVGRYSLCRECGNASACLRLATHPECHRAAGKARAAFSRERWATLSDNEKQAIYAAVYARGIADPSLLHVAARDGRVLIFDSCLLLPQDGAWARVVFQAHFQRILSKGWAVHHIDEDPANNDPANLAAMTTRQHNKLIHKKRFLLRLAGVAPNGDAILEIA